MGSRIISLTTTFIPIIIISASMMVYNSAKATIDNSLTQMSQSEISAFNSIYITYQGDTTGSQVKALIGDLIVNSTTYEEEVDKIPALTIVDKINYNGDIVMNAKKPKDSSKVQEYKDNLSDIKSKVENKHTYNVELEYDNNNLVNEIKISYNSED